MRIVGVLLSPRFEFEGLALQGSASELGLNSLNDVKTTKNLNEIEYLVNHAKCNITGITDVYKTKTGAVELVLVNNIHLYDYPLLYRGNDNRILKIPNGVEIVEQCVTHDRVKMHDIVMSYGVVFDFDSTRRITRKSPAMLAVLSTYFKPKNFLVKQASNGEVSFSGKPGVSLKQLPVTRLDYREKGTIVEEKENKQVSQLRNARTSDVSKGDTTLAKAMTVDFLDVAQLMEQAQAQFVYLPSTNGAYTALTIDVERSTVESEFVPSGIEYAKPEIKYSITTPKLSLSFVKYGKVGVDFEGQRIAVPCSMITSKTIFNLQDKHMQKLMVSCPTSTVNWLQEQLLARTLTFDVSTEETLNALVHGAMGLEKSDNVLLNVDTTNLIPISQSKYDSFLSYRLSNIVSKVINLQAVAKWVDTKQQGLRMVATSSVRDIARPFRGYSTEMLKAMEAVGIDIYTGIYKPLVNNSYTKSADIKFEFTFKGFKAPTGKELVDNIEEVRAGKSAPHLTEGLNTIARLSDGLLNIDARDLKEMHNYLEREGKAVKTALQSCIKALWCYNQCAVAKGDYSKYNDGKQYEAIVNARLKNGRDYGGEDGLVVRLVGIEMEESNVIQ